MVTALSMKYARHGPGSYKVHMKYGRLTPDDVKAACDALRGSRECNDHPQLALCTDGHCEGVATSPPEEVVRPKDTSLRSSTSLRVGCCGKCHSLRRQAWHNNGVDGASCLRCELP